MSTCETLTQLGEIVDMTRTVKLNAPPFNIEVDVSPGIEEMFLMSP
jgi:hypothetical protein